MRRIVGSVLTARSRTGVANLIVVAYDLSSRGLALRDPRPTVEQLEAVGVRLGSDSTDQCGAFEIPLDLLDAEPQHPSSGEAAEAHRNLGRPPTAVVINLLVVVFAPDDAVALAGQDRRALSSSSIRPNVTSEQEAFVLMVDDSYMLVRADPGPDFATQVEEAYARSTALKARLAEKHRAIREDALERMAKAREKVADLSAIPLDLRKRSNFIVIAKRDLAGNLSKIQRDVMQEGCSRFQERADVPRLMRLVLNDQQVETLGLKIEGGKLTGEIKPETISGVLRSAIGGTSLTRTIRVDLAEIARLEARYLSEPRASVPKAKRAGAAMTRPAVTPAGKTAAGTSKKTAGRRKTPASKKSA